MLQGGDHAYYRTLIQKLGLKSQCAVPTCESDYPMSIPLALRAERCLPDDGYTGILVGRVWRPELAGPSVVAIREGGIYDLSVEFPTMSSLLARKFG